MTPFKRCRFFALAYFCLFFVPFGAAHAAAETPDKQADGANYQSSFAAGQNPPQTGSGAPPPVARPGDPGWPFPSDHWWSHIALEIGGGYSPVTSQGAAKYFSPGYNGYGGVIDRVSSHWGLLAEVQVFGLNAGFTGSTSTTVPSFDLAAIYGFQPHSATGFYLIGGAGFYRLAASVTCTVGEVCPYIPPANSAGLVGGIGIRHRFIAGKTTEIFAESRYQYIASDSSAFGQLSLMPVSGGIRW